MKASQEPKQSFGHVLAEMKQHRPPIPGIHRIRRAGIRSVGQLVGAIPRSSSRDAAMFCWLLGSLPSRTAERALVAALSGPRSSVWLEAAKSLMAIGRAPSAAALVRLMLMGHDRRRRVACAYALGWIDAGPHLAEVVRALTSVVAGSDDSDVRSHAAESLGNRLRFGRVAGRRAAERVLIDGLRDEHSDVRFWCAYALGQMKSRAAIVPLRALTGDKAVVPRWWQVGLEARDALTTIRGGTPPDRNRSR